MSQLSLLAPQLEAPTVIDSSHSSPREQPDRPQAQKIQALVGQSIASYLIDSAIATNRIAPAYLFTGVDGIGKTLAAKVFMAKLLGSNSINSHADLMWVEPTYLHQGELVQNSELVDALVKRKYPPQIRIEQIREVTQFLNCLSLVAPRKVVIIKDAHCMATAAANALLKTLEEPINGTIILISSQSQKLLPTIISRTHVIPFHRLNCTQTMAVLEKLERLDILSDPTVLSLAAGSPGQAIAHYEQLQSIKHELLTQFLSPPTDALIAMQIAKQVDIQLEYDQQIWLLDYLQHSWWHRYHDVTLVQKVESAKTAINKMVGSRLVWENLLLCSTAKISFKV